MIVKYNLSPTPRLFCENYTDAVFFVLWSRVTKTCHEAYVYNRIPIAVCFNYRSSNRELNVKDGLVEFSLSDVEKMDFVLEDAKDITHFIRYEKLRLET